MFISVNGKAKKVTDIFAGGKDGKAHKITELFGSVNGVAKQLYTIEKKTNAFDQFTWDEIKQLADNGQLLEHFSLGDRVTVKLKEPLRNDMKMYMSGFGIYITVPQVQNEIMFQITYLSETKMELTCPRVTALGTADSDIPTYFGNYNSEDKEFHYAYDFYYNRNSARSLVYYAWGFSPMYDALKTIDNSLPDELRNVLSVPSSKPLISYGNHPITGNIVEVYDEELRVRQAGKNEIVRSLDMTNDTIYYPIIENSWFSSSVGEWLYNINIPAEYDSYKVRRYLVANMFKGYNMLDHRYKDGTVYQSYSDVPYTTCYFSKGITNNDDYNKFLASGKITNTSQSNDSYCNVVLPRIIIGSN